MIKMITGLLLFYIVILVISLFMNKKRNVHYVINKKVNPWVIFAFISGFSLVMLICSGSYLIENNDYNLLLTINILTILGGLGIGLQIEFNRLNKEKFFFIVTAVFLVILFLGMMSIPYFGPIMFVALVFSFVGMSIITGPGLLIEIMKRRKTKQMKFKFK